MAALTIPETAGAILLPDCTLFPHGALPLHIFEERYQQMLTEALEGDCLICVARLLRDEEPDLTSCTSPVGTIGLIRASRELPDGRSHLILHGVCRVRFEDWLPGKSFPFARIQSVTSTQGPRFEWDEQLTRLRASVERVIEGFPGKVVTQIRGLLDQTPTPAIMADAVAQQFVHESDLRQQILEEEDVPIRVDLVVRHLEQLPPPGPD